MSISCQGCGVGLEPSEEQVNSAVDQILETSLRDAEKRGGVCPLCGHSKKTPPSQRKSVLFVLLMVCVLTLGALAVTVWLWRETERGGVVDAAIARMNGNADLVRRIGAPVTAKSGVAGEVRHDETGWKEAKLVIPVRGPKGEARVHVIGGRGTEDWVFTTFEIVFESEHKKLDLITGRVVDYDPNAYVDIHTQAPVLPEYSYGFIPTPRLDGTFPCVGATVSSAGISVELGKCSTPTTHAGAVDRFEADLRDGSFVLRETDLSLNDVFDAPLTRSYRSNDWVHKNRVHAFGRNSNHPYDITPLGSRNPYTYQILALEDGEFLYFDRISKGAGYADAAYMHTETSTRFYKATQQWNGGGWTTKLADGSEIVFPESYNAKNMAQGAAIEMRDANGNRLELHRDGQRNLQEIRTPHGRWIRFSYDDMDRITHAEDDAGNWARYEYNSDGMLTTVALSSGRQRHYEYDGVRMTVIQDESGNVLLRNSYQKGLLKQQEFSRGIVYSYSYEWNVDKSYLEKAAVTMPDHTTKELPVADSAPMFVRNLQHR